MRGFSGNRIWQNGRWLDLAQLAPALKGASAAWAGISVTEQNDSGALVGTATKKSDLKPYAVLLLPIEILVPRLKKNQDGSESFDYDANGSPKLKSASRLAIGTLENSFETSQQRPLKADWIEQDPDHFYVRVTDPAHSGTGPMKVRVWTDSEGSDYDDDDRSSTDSNVVDLYEEGTTGVFKSKALLLVSNDGDDQEIVDYAADNAPNDRTWKIAVGGALKVEFLGYKQGPSYVADIESSVPVVRSIKLKVFVPKIALLGPPTPVIDTPSVTEDLRIVKETFAQAGIRIVGESVVEFDDSAAGIALGINGFTVSGETPSPEGEALFNWVDANGLRGADEIGIVYANYLSSGALSGDSGLRALAYIVKNNADPKYAGYAVVSVARKARYTLAHELLHVLLNAEHLPGTDDFPAEFANIRMTWSGGPDEPGVLGRKRITKRLNGKQVGKIQLSPYAK